MRTEPVGRLGAGPPVGVAVNPDNDTIYVSTIVDDDIAVINGATNTITSTIPLADPGAISVDPATGTLVAADGKDTVSVITFQPR